MNTLLLIDPDDWQRSLAEFTEYERDIGMQSRALGVDSEMVTPFGFALKARAAAARSAEVSAAPFIQADSAMIHDDPSLCGGGRKPFNVPATGHAAMTVEVIGEALGQAPGRTKENAT